MAQIRAMSSTDAFFTLDPFALVGPDDPWHTDLEAKFDRSRYGVVARITRRLTPGPGRPEFVHLGIVGHRGTGKTTQVRKAIADLAPTGIFPVFIDALTSFDQGDLKFSDLVLVVAQGVVEALAAARVDVPAQELEKLRLWFAEELLTETHRKQILGSLQT
jgi:hypothetical protein